MEVRSSAIGMQMQVANYPEGAVFKRYGTERLEKRVRLRRIQVCIKKLNESKPSEEVSKRLLAVWQGKKTSDYQLG